MELTRSTLLYIRLDLCVSVFGHMEKAKTCKSLEKHSSLKLRIILKCKLEKAIKRDGQWQREAMALADWQLNEYKNKLNGKQKGQTKTAKRTLEKM